MQEQIKKTLKALALADAIIMPNWEYRYFSYNANWADGEELSTIKNGSGEETYIWFVKNKVVWKYFEPEQGRIENMEDIKERLSTDFSQFINEPAFDFANTTAVWYMLDSRSWVKFGKEGVFVDKEIQKLTWKPEDYAEWAREYYEIEPDIQALRSIFELHVNPEMIRRLNPDIDIDALAADLKEIGVNSINE